jgi:hypothetical protein
VINKRKPSFIDYLGKIEKMYLADNDITSLSFVSEIPNLRLLYFCTYSFYLASNKLKSLKGI